MDTHHVRNCEQIIRDDMIRFQTSLKAISSIVNDTNMDTSNRLTAIKHICRLTITPVNPK